mmetsp:Transcript_34198/g.72819  ORF Transcript_34198/g.72819 Transcript_34198/m.72819 type:complete len:325 (-) Transcript_34198:383-1357(-)|eukprot:CAMPEP_0206581674 /NCGR_PEP_ID=MMETSP0325_2-20121206/33990_1 /ASSEMBLY_ACC=CAM_ASM_000347 /TAXON_ID=2866 /ORGANISM="Crypthecodinium cohnii, Strain Seligo" /LENGTH=324 /DNA_ID=CAMNT_0054088131 /DNA_START=10 /DNA_END=984 /DNA_ORIENTATION=+
MTEVGLKVAVVGSGMMGKGIAACLAAGGPHEVMLYGRRAEAAQDAKKQADVLLKFMVDNDIAAKSCGNIVPTSSLKEAVTGAAFVFETIAEDVQIKQAMFKELEGLTTSSTVLCTNTSSLSVTEISKGLTDAGATRFVAAHFIGPAHLVPLVEVCPCTAAAAAAEGKPPSETPVGRVSDFLKSCGKKPVILKKEIDGFLAARLQAALYRECLHIVECGVADPEAVDGAVFNGFGRRFTEIGPFIQADFAGVDLTQRTHATFFPQLGAAQRDVRADRLVPEGRLGVKALKGHHDWTAEKVQEVAGRRDAELLRRLKVDRARESKL